MTAYHRAYLPLEDGRVKWVVYETHAGRGMIPLVEGTERSKLKAVIKAWKASR